MTDGPFKNALKLLVSNYYIIFQDGKPVITEKFTRELAEVKAPDLYTNMRDVMAPVKDSYKVTGTELTPLPKSTKKMVLAEPGKSMPFQEFILQSEVPGKVYMQGGGFYWANKYSKEAELEFLKILAKGYQLDILLAATKLYYKSGGSVEAITNYITRGTWVTHYTEMEKNLQAGTTDTYIKDTLKEETTGKTSYLDR